MTKVAKKKQEVRGLVKSVGKNINLSCGPLYFSVPSKSPLDIVPTNGTFGLVDTGKKKILVTCHHVWKHLKEEQANDSRIRMFVCLDANGPVAFEDS